VAVGRLASLKTSSLIGINTNVSLYLADGNLSEVTVSITNQGLDEAKYFVGISSGSLEVAKSSDYVIFNKPLERNEFVSVNVGVKSGDLIFCRASKKDVTFLAFSTLDYSSQISNFYGRENSFKTSDSINEPNSNIILFTSNNESKTTLVVENDSFDSAFVSAGISSGGETEFKSSDYLFYAKKLAPRESYKFENIGIGINQSLVVRASKTNVRFAAFSVPANLSAAGDFFVDGTLSSSGVVTSVGGFNLGISSAGTTVSSGPVKTLNFIGTGNTFTYNSSTRTLDISIQSGGSAGAGGTWASNSAGIHTSKNVGIGTTVSRNALTVIGNATISGVVTASRFESETSGTPTIDSPNNLNINAVNVAISTDLTVARDAYVGIGTTTGVVLTDSDGIQWRIGVTTTGSLFTTLV